MKELNNKIVKCTSVEQGQEISKEFKRLGIYTDRDFDCVGDYYGIIDNQFNLYYLHEINWYKVRLITLDELKSIGKSEYPKKMLVSDNDVDWLEVAINGECIYKNKTIYIQEADGVLVPWKLAKDIEETPALYLDEILALAEKQAGHKIKLKK